MIELLNKGIDGQVSDLPQKAFCDLWSYPWIDSFTSYDVSFWPLVNKLQPWSPYKWEDIQSSRKSHKSRKSFAFCSLGNVRKILVNASSLRLSTVWSAVDLSVRKYVKIIILEFSKSSIIRKKSENCIFQEMVGTQNGVKTAYKLPKLSSHPIF